MTHKISLIVATKDRPDDLRTLLRSLSGQSVAPDEVIVVDSSSHSVEPVLNEFSTLTIRYLKHWPPSAAAQRNSGIKACAPSSTLIGFADDDTTFEPQAFENMLKFWSEAAPDVLGAAFNIRNYPDRGNAILKRSALTQWLGLYSSRPGSVSLSGWQSIIEQTTQTQFVDWLPSGASIFRREVFSRTQFDDFFESYSYLEDLDFSYTVSRLGRLAVVADAGFSHFASPTGRISGRQFGRYEVRNRLYFVRKHHLSLFRCYLGLTVRLAMSAAFGLSRLNANMVGRALGNLEEMVKLCSTPARRVSKAPTKA